MVQGLIPCITFSIHLYKNKPLKTLFISFIFSYLVFASEQNHTGILSRLVIYFRLIPGVGGGVALFLPHIFSPVASKSNPWKVF